MTTARVGEDLDTIERHWNMRAHRRWPGSVSLRTGGRQTCEAEAAGVNTEKFLASLAANARVERADYGISNRNLVLAGYFGDNSRQVVLFDQFDSLPIGESKHSV